MKKTTRKKRNNPPSRLIDARIMELGDWRGETLARRRSLIKQADPRSRGGVEVGEAYEPGNTRVVARQNRLHG